MRVPIVVVTLVAASWRVAPLTAQPSRGLRPSAACRCEPGKSRRPRVLLPIAGGLGFLPVALAVRDSGPPSLDFPSLVDIHDNSPRTAREGQLALNIGALAPDTATTLPTLMVVAIALLVAGMYLTMPRRRRRVGGAWRTLGGRRGQWRLRSVHRRRLGIGIATTGTALLLLGSREYAEGAQAQRRARAEWLRVGALAVAINPDSVSAPTPRGAAVPPRSPLERADNLTSPIVPGAARDRSIVPLPVMVGSPHELRRGTPVARLVIPSIDLDEIVIEGVGPLELNSGPGHFPGSVLPGEAGNSVISAHRDRHFRRMDELVIGTRIRTETRAGSVEWVVAERRIVSRDTPALFQASSATLTLTTCWPVRYFGPAPDRLIILAKRAE